jgi:hypothetical protein
MKSMQVSELRVGDCFDRSLFLPGGQKIVPAGTTITERHIDMLMRQSSAKLFLAQTAEEVAKASAMARVLLQVARASRRQMPGPMTRTPRRFASSALPRPRRSPIAWPNSQPP